MLYLPSRCHLRLIGVEVNAAVSRKLSCIVSLVTLDLNGCEVEDGALQELVWMPKLQHVVLAEKQRGQLKAKGLKQGKFSLKYGI